MSAIKKSVSFPDELYDAAVARQHELKYTTFSDYLQALIRADMKNAVASGNELNTDQIAVLRDQVSKITSTLDRLSGQPTKYPASRRRRKADIIPPSPKG